MKFKRYKIKDGRTIARWKKDGAWHITEPYEPTEHDRAMFPASYPAGDNGPFFVWSIQSFNSESEALQFAANNPIEVNHHD